MSYQPPTRSQMQASADYLNDLQDPLEALRERARAIAREADETGLEAAGIGSRVSHRLSTIADLLDACQEMLWDLRYTYDDNARRKADINRSDQKVEAIEKILRGEI